MKKWNKAETCCVKTICLVINFSPLLSTNIYIWQRFTSNTVYGLQRYIYIAYKNSWTFGSSFSMLWFGVKTSALCFLPFLSKISLFFFKNTGCSESVEPGYKIHRHATKEHQDFRIGRVVDPPSFAARARSQLVRGRTCT